MQLHLLNIQKLMAGVPQEPCLGVVTWSERSGIRMTRF